MAAVGYPFHVRALVSNCVRRELLPIRIYVSLHLCSSINFTGQMVFCYSTERLGLVGARI